MLVFNLILLLAMITGATGVILAVNDKKQNEIEFQKFVATCDKIEKRLDLANKIIEDNSKNKRNT